MKITYTKHALKKFSDLKRLGITVVKKQIREIIEHPEHIDTDTDPPQIIASGDFDDKRILRVVYRKEDDIMIVITFYPAKKGRYYI